MRFGNWLILVILMTAMGGCSIYPLPQDATGSNTKDIVANIRCQARVAVRQAALNELRSRLINKKVFANYKGAGLADALENNSVQWSKLDIKYFTGDAKDVVAYYGNTIITYEFTLQTTEDNKQGASIDLIRKFTRRADTIGLAATADRMRDVSRVVTLHDTFWNLATRVDDNYCRKSHDIDIVFPSRSQLPVADLIDTYVYLNEWGTLDMVKPNLQGTNKGPATRQMADTIMFTTNISSVNNPTIKYNPVGAGFFTSGVGFINENSRKDLHKVIITLTTSDVPDGKGDYKAIAILPPDVTRKSGLDAIASVREKNFQDDISTIARSVNQLSLFGP